MVSSPRSRSVDLVIMGASRAVGSLVVTVPSVAYLLQPNPNKHHGHGHGEGEYGAHDDHKEGHEDGKENVDEDSSDPEKDDGESKNEESTEQDQSQQDEDTQESTQEVAQDTPNTSDDTSTEHTEEKDGGGNVEGVQFKGATSGGSREGEQGDTRKRVPDSKGFYKKRIESDYGNRQGALDENESEDGDKVFSWRCLFPPSSVADHSNSQLLLNLLAFQIRSLKSRRG